MCVCVHYFNEDYVYLSVFIFTVVYHLLFCVYQNVIFTRKYLILRYFIRAQNYGLLYIGKFYRRFYRLYQNLQDLI